MRYRLRTLLIVLALGPPLIAWLTPLASNAVNAYRDRQRPPLRSWGFTTTTNIQIVVIEEPLLPLAPEIVEEVTAPASDRIDLGTVTLKCGRQLPAGASNR